jgi:sortase (surface protein transpeptidase)
VSITIPAIGVHSKLLDLGVNPNGSLQVPPLNDTPATNEAAWFRYSPTPGQLGASVIEGHIDSIYQGPSVFFRLGALAPGDTIDVRLADRIVAVFRVDGVRQFAKAAFPTSVLYGDPGYAALRLVTCGGAFDGSTHNYLANIVVAAHLVSSHPAG